MTVNPNRGLDNNSTHELLLISTLKLDKYMGCPFMGASTLQTPLADPFKLHWCSTISVPHVINTASVIRIELILLTIYKTVNSKGFKGTSNRIIRKANL